MFSVDQVISFSKSGRHIVFSFLLMDSVAFRRLSKGTHPCNQMEAQNVTGSDHALPLPWPPSHGRAFPTALSSGTPTHQPHCGALSSWNSSLLHRVLVLALPQPASFWPAQRCLPLRPHTGKGGSRAGALTLGSHGAGQVPSRRLSAVLPPWDGVFLLYSSVTRKECLVFSINNPQHEAMKLTF